MEFRSEDDFIEHLAEEVEKSDKAVKKLRNCIRALKAQRNRALEEQLSRSEAQATEQVQETLQLIKEGPHSNSALSRVTSNDEFVGLKAAFKKTVRALNVCMQDIQQQSLTVSYEGTAAGAEIHTQDARHDEDEHAHGPATDNMELELVFNSEEVDVDREIEAENRQDAMKLAQDTVVLRDMMGETTTMIKDQGEQLKVVDQTVESAAEITESAVEELTQARKHQKATQKIKVIIASVCGCIVLTAIIIIIIRYATPAGSTAISVAATTTTVAPAAQTATTTGSGSGGGSGRLLLRRVLQGDALGAVSALDAVVGGDGWRP